MATLTPGKTVSSRAPDLLVENALAPGKWRFQLVVVDDDKNESEPFELVVEVVALRPIRPLRPVEPVVLTRPVTPVLRPR